MEKAVALALGFFMSCISMTVFADGHSKGFSVSEKQFGRLQQTVNESKGTLIQRLQAILTDMDDPEVIPRNRDRRIFRQDMEALMGRVKNDQTVSGWIGFVKQNQQTPTPKPTSLEVTGFWVVGNGDTKDSGKAYNAHSDECSKVEQFLRGVLGASFDTFSCGKTSNVAPYANIGYYQFASSPTLTVKVPGGQNVRKVAGNRVSGSESSKQVFGPYSSWMSACKTWISKQKQNYGGRFVAASCGSPSNVAKYANIGYKQYSSTGVLYIRD